MWLTIHNHNGGFVVVVINRLIILKVNVYINVFRVTNRHRHLGISKALTARELRI